MGFLIGLAARFVGARFAPLLVYGLIGAALVGGIWWLRSDAYRDGVRHERNRMEAAVAKANQRFQEQKARADELADRQRITDLNFINRQEQELRNAIATTPDTAPDAVRVRLGCERLRRAPGANPANLPAVCRSGG